MKDTMFSKIKLDVQRGSQSRTAKISEQTAIAIIAAKSSGQTAKQVADLHGCGESTVKSIWQRKSWNHLPRPRAAE